MLKIICFHNFIDVTDLVKADVYEFWRLIRSKGLRFFPKSLENEVRIYVFVVRPGPNSCHGRRQNSLFSQTGQIISLSSVPTIPRMLINHTTASRQPQ